MNIEVINRENTLLFYNELTDKEQRIEVTFENDSFFDDLGNEFYAIYSTDEKYAVIYSDYGFVITGVDIIAPRVLTPDLHLVYSEIPIENPNYHQYNKEQLGDYWYLEPLEEWKNTNEHFLDFIKKNPFISIMCIQNFFTNCYL